LPPIVYVMGPSGAGKDSLLRFARERIQSAERIAFAHRYITRPVDGSGENHVALSPVEFEARRMAGLFAFDWRAHETSYGIGIEIEAWRRAGFLVVVNGSRRHFATIVSSRNDVVPVIVTASAEVLAERLARRARENRAEILARLQRDAELPATPNQQIIDNSGTLAEAGEALLALLRASARSPAYA
jgi:ribose 1,5-bisphosphokinase